MNIKRIVIGISLAAMLVVGAGAASAQVGEPGRPNRPGPAIGMQARQGGDVMRALVDIITEATGLTAREFLAQVRDGATPAEVIAANDGDVDTVRAEAIALLTEEINEAVADERLSQERADMMLGNLEQRVDDALNGELGFGLRDRFEDRRGRGRGDMPSERSQVVLELAAEQTGLTTDEILAEVQAGATFGDVLRANDVDIEAFVEQVIAEAEERMNNAQSERLETLRERLLERLNRTAVDAE